MYLRLASQLSLAVTVLLALAGQTGAQIVLQTQDLQLEVGADGLAKSLRDKSSGTEYIWTGAPMPIASVYRGGQMAVGSQEDYGEFEAPLYRGGECFTASAASLSGDTLTIRFGQANVTATYRVTTEPQYLAFKLLALEGDSIDRIDLVQLRIRRLPFLGPWIDAAWDEQFALCLCAGNIQTNAGMSPHAGYVEMRAIATREVALEGATAVLFGCPNPKERFLDVMEVVERDFQMPSGARNRRSPAQKYSYLWCSPTVDDVAQYIAVAKRAGFRMILLSYTGFTQGAGHFRFNSRFPRRSDDLKEVTDRIRGAGLAVGMHIHYSKADRTDPYVAPVPDDRLHQVRRFTLSAAVDEKADAISVRENPAGCARDDGRRILKVGKELIAYRDMGPDVLEYVLSRGAAWDCPFSLRLTLADAAAHPRADDCFDTIKIWEDARIAGKLTDAQRTMLKTLDPSEYRYVKIWHAVFGPQWIEAWSKGTFNDQEHHLFLNEQGEYELVPMREVPAVAAGRVKAFLFQRPAQPDDTFVVLWAGQGELSLTLSVSPEQLTVMRPFGTKLAFEKDPSGAGVAIGSRRYLRLADIGTEQATEILQGAK